jgi:anti-sigma factor RsiW
MKYQEDASLSELIKSQATYYEAPQSLRRNIGIALAAANQAHAAPWYKAWFSWQQWTGMGVAFACGVLLSVTTIQYFGDQGHQELIATQVINGHVRSLMAAHLSDVTSSDQHTVKPWFIGKLDYAPPITDLSVDDYPLVGGRLDYMDERPVAALVYRHHQHTINVFVWPARSLASQNLGTLTKKGFNAAVWQSDGMQYWAVSDLNTVDLNKFAELMRIRKLTQS